MDEKYKEYIGLEADSVSEQIRALNPECHVVSLPIDSFVTMDYRLDRIRIRYNSNGMVVSIKHG